MQVDYLLIGQGICGTFLSWELQKAGYSCCIMDEQRPDSASKVAAGIINPVTGRRIVKTWLIDEVLPFACDAYNELGGLLGITAIEQKDIVDFFPTPQMKLAFNKRFEEDQQYLAVSDDEGLWRPHFNYDFGFGMITPCYLVNLAALLPAYRKLVTIREEFFDLERLQVAADGIEYDDITARGIIFCDGIASFANPYFNVLPFAPNKGEVLLVEAEGVPNHHIFKKGINWVPYQPGIFWVGSSYEWQFVHDLPTEAFREKTLAVLKHWIKAPIRLLDHKAAVRPATLERRPFIGFHPLFPSVGIFNGMGTKGCSLAPFFARQFVQHIHEGVPLPAEADVARFRRVLSR